jgi:imidazoleglycerol-phosphate dehydratase/histidinol-phosphatase
MLKKYAFLDRDGTLIYEPQDNFQIDSLEKLKILPGVIDGLKKLIGDGFSLVIVTNQDGLGETSFPLENFEIPQNKMLEIFRENGIEFAAVFVCPHRASDNCSCRKPKTGLVDGFFKDKVDVDNSFVYGDRETDREFAKNLNLKFFKAKTNGKFDLEN